MTLQKLGINPDSAPYLALSHKYRRGLGWLRKCVGTPSDIQDGVVAFYNLPKELSNAGDERTLISTPNDCDTPREQAIKYFTELGSLVSPWQKMFTNPPFHRFNRQVSRFASNYDSPSFFPQTKRERLIEAMLKVLRIQIEQREAEYAEKRKLEPENNNESSINLDDLGSEMDMSPEAVKAREERIIANNERRNFRKMKPYRDEIAIASVLQHADPGYVLAVLTSNEVGLKHKDDSVRMGAINIIQSIANLVIPALSNELNSKGVIIGVSKKEYDEELIDSAVALLSSIFRTVNVKGYGCYDTNYAIRVKSEDIDRTVTDSLIALSKLKRSSQIN